MLEGSRRSRLAGSRRFRLSGVGAFEAVFRAGQRREGRFLQMVCAAAARDVGRVGIVIGRQALPLAVDRNRVRRMLRVRLDAARPAIERYDLVLRLKRRAVRAEFPLIAEEAQQMLRSLPGNRELP
jgi:ribonuclease P protein component